MDPFPSTIAFFKRALKQIKLSKNLFIFCFTVAAILACAGPNPDEGQVLSDTSSSEGKKVFQKYCVSCHGVHGDLGSNGAFNLVSSTLSPDEKILVITKGRNTMTAFGNVLSPEQIEAVAIYTEQFKSR
jgi:mono/diheme cytochrome c family protein